MSGALFVVQTAYTTFVPGYRHNCYLRIDPIVTDIDIFVTLVSRVCKGMDDRTCALCEKTFSKPVFLRRHLARKTSCAPILESADLPEQTLKDPDLEKKKCRFCGRVFSSYDSMRRHVRNTCRIAPNRRNGEGGLELLYEHTIRRQQTQIDQLSSLVEKLVTSGGSTGNTGAQAGEVAIQNGEGQVAVDNRHIHINIFGQESLDHVTMERIKAVLDESIRAPALLVAANTAILKTAMLVYSDPDRPENLTCYLPNKKTNDALVHLSRPDGTTGWEVRPTTLVLPPMAQKSVDMLFDRQPFEDAEEYAPLMKDLRDNEARYTAGGELRPILVRNKELLARALESLPIGGTQ